MGMTNDGLSHWLAETDGEPLLEVTIGELLEPVKNVSRGIKLATDGGLSPCLMKAEQLDTIPSIMRKGSQSRKRMLCRLLSPQNHQK